MIPPVIQLPAKTDANVLKSTQHIAANYLLNDTPSREVSTTVVVDVFLLMCSCCG